jgi:2,3-bisphosphoglycerate-independent phosphoglycerate mutase
MLFWDGVGIGRASRETNPFFAADLPEFRKLFDGAMPHLSQRALHNNTASVVPLNATLGVEGLPQSGTGQTALFTGINAPRLIGKHFGPYPYSTLRPVIARENIFRKLTDRHRSVYYANAYPQRYFDHLATHKNRITVMPMAWMDCGFQLNDLDALREEAALSADITGDGWVKRGFGKVPILHPREAGHRLVSLLEKHDFVLYDYFYTDHIGHSMSMDEAVGVLGMLDQFVGGIVEAMDFKRMLLLVTSDHGNLEDLSRKTHTRNPVPLVVVGSNHRKCAPQMKKLTHVTPAVVDLLT